MNPTLNLNLSLNLNPGGSSMELPELAGRDAGAPRRKALVHRLPTSGCHILAVALPLMFLLFSQVCSGAEAAVTNQVALLANVKSMDFLDDHQKLGPGDRITYRVIEDQDDARSLTVGDSGDVEVPYYGLVHAAGKTSLQLAREVKALLEKSLYFQATVIIAVELVNKTRVTGKVYVTGQVRNKGGYDIPAGENLTVSKAILLAGGFSDFSDKKRVRLIRKTTQGQRTYTVNVAEVWEKSKLEQDIPVQPDDTIVVLPRLVNY